MKANSTHLVLIRAILFLLVLLYSLIVFAKPSDSLVKIQPVKKQEERKNQQTSIVNKSQPVFAIVRRG